MVTIKFEADQNRSVALDDGKKIGECVFTRTDAVWTIVHTEVNHTYGGRGIAGKLLQNVLDNAKYEGVKIIPQCSYAARVMQDSEEYRDLLIK